MAASFARHGTTTCPGLLLLQDCCTRLRMPSQPLQVSEARKRLSALVERVARGGAAVTIGRYGRERAVLVGADEFARLRRAANTTMAPRPATLEGMLTLTCTPEELIAESRKLGELWLTAFEESAKRLKRRRRARRA